MSHRVKLKITKAEDRDLMAAIMVRNGYGVRPAKMKRPDSKSWLSGLEISDIPDQEVVKDERL